MNMHILVLILLVVTMVIVTVATTACVKPKTASGAKLDSRFLCKEDIDCKYATNLVKAQSKVVDGVSIPIDAKDRDPNTPVEYLAACINPAEVSDSSSLTYNNSVRCKCEVLTVQENPEDAGIKICKQV